MEYYDFYDLFENCEEYPENVAERGIPQNTYYSYISTTFLNGFINYVKIKRILMIERYTFFHPKKNDYLIKNFPTFHCDFNNDIIFEEEIFNEEEINKIERELVISKNEGLEITDILDDIIIFGETENSYWIFWSDRDCSDSCIGRTDKKITMEEFQKLFLNNIKKNFSGNYLELPIPTGWVTL